VEQVEGGGVVVPLVPRVVFLNHCGLRPETPEQLARVIVGRTGVAVVGGALAVERQIEGLVVAGGGGAGVGRPGGRDGELVAVPIQRDVEGRVRPRHGGAVEGRGDGRVPVETGGGGPVGRQVQHRPGRVRAALGAVVVGAVVAAAVVVAVVEKVVVEPAARQVVARGGGVVRAVVEGARFLLGAGGAVIRGRRDFPGLEAVEFVGAVGEERTAPAEIDAGGLHAGKGRGGSGGERGDNWKHARSYAVEAAVMLISRGRRKKKELIRALEFENNK